MKKLEEYVKSIPDFPEKGIIFRDVTSVLQDADGLHLAIDTMQEKIKDLDYDVVVGPEFVTGSSRMKAGTAQKLVLNMISTATMIQLGKVKGNKMVDMQLSNTKLIDRGTRMIMEEIPVSYEEANQLLNTHGSVRSAVDFYNNNKYK